MNQHTISTTSHHFWLRAEVKPGEKRTAVLPEHAAKLIAAGHTLTVESSLTRCVDDQQYKEVGCTIVPAGSWKTLAPANTLILGLKELDEESQGPAHYPITHRHIYFAHCYKNQGGWKELLQRFVLGNGTLYDMEFLTFENGVRVAAFGRCAGFTGMAVGLQNWCHQLKQMLHQHQHHASQQELLPSLHYWSDFAATTAEIQQNLTEVSTLAGANSAIIPRAKPKIMILGALGRCGQGAVALARSVGLVIGEDVTLWDINETKGKGPFNELVTDYDILVNCIYLAPNPDNPVKPFITNEMLDSTLRPRRLSVIVDVSCDISNPQNPLPVYKTGTTFFEPSLRIRNGTDLSIPLPAGEKVNTPLDVISIDHLPSLVPLESSKEFGDALISHLIQCESSDVWTRAKQLFINKTAQIREELKQARQHVWLREETKENERRTPLTPHTARILIENGFTVTVERSTQRVFADVEYEKEGCILVDGGSWKTAPRTATILGLHGVPSEDNSPLHHQHICFGYAYNHQSGWRELLSRFVEGGGSLLDISYLTDSQGRRLTTFARIAGHVGMAAALLLWAHQQLHRPSSGSMKRSRSKEQLSQLAEATEVDKNVPLAEYILSQLRKAIQLVHDKQPPSVVVIGGNGRVGQGAVAFARKLGLQPVVWTRKDTAVGGEKGIPSLVGFDILVNAVKLDDAQKTPFLTTELLVNHPERELSIIVDLSCDVYRPNNPLPIYHSTTSFSSPMQRIIHSEHPLDLVAIENLAGLLPRESSIHFASQLLPHLFHLSDTEYPVWQRALGVFLEKTKPLRAQFASAAHGAASIFATGVPVLQLPTDYPRPSLEDTNDRSSSTVSFDAVNQTDFVSICANLPESGGAEVLFSKLAQLISKRSITSSATNHATTTINLFGLLTAVFEILLHRLSGEEDFMLGVLRVQQSPHQQHRQQQQHQQLSVYGIRANVTSSADVFQVLRQTAQDLEKNEFTAVSISLPSPASGDTTTAPVRVDVDVSKLWQGISPNFQATVVDSADNQKMRHTAQQMLQWTDVVLLVQRPSPPSTSVAEVNVELVYRKDLFSRERAQEMLNQLQFLLEQVLQSTAAATPTPTALHDQGQQQQQKSFAVGSFSLVTRNSPVPNPRDLLDTTWEGPITHHFHNNALRLPAHQLAVVHDTTQLTYKQLDDLTSQLANYLIAKGLQLEDGVFIWGYRNVCMPWAFIGCLKAGGAVSLMDPVYPSERIINCLKVAPPKCWLSIQAAGAVPADVEEYLNEIGCNIRLTLPLPEEAAQQGIFKEYSTEFDYSKVPIQEDTVAVITFTSGSTGLPKAVEGRHGPLTHFYPWMRSRFGLSSEDQISMCSGISHDPIQRDIFTPLFVGGTIHIPNAADIQTPGQLAVWMKQHRITWSHLTPAMGQLLSDTAAADTVVESLRVTLFVGDKLTKRDVLRLRKVAPRVLCVNMYGSTETQRAVSYYPVPDNSQLCAMKEILPVGKGMKDVMLVLLNSEEVHTGVGELGEIYMRSPHLAKGYKGLPEQTREKFCVNPFTQQPRDRLYRTGDLGRYMVDGSVDVTGRVDNQVKIRGFRIELGEINTMLAQHPAVRENVPLVREDIPGDKRIVAYVVPHTGQLVPAGHELRRFLEKKLPNYMVPAAFVVLKSIPLTPNGKINHAALPAPERLPKARLDEAPAAVTTTSAAIPTGEADLHQLKLTEHSFKGFWKEMFPDMIFGEDSSSPLSSTSEGAGSGFDADQAKLAALWRDILGVPEVSANDSFFDLGGHSLLLTRLMFHINKSFGVSIPLDVITQHPTLAGLSLAIGQLRAAASKSVITDVSSTSSPSSSSSSSQDTHSFLMNELQNLSSAIPSSIVVPDVLAESRGGDHQHIFLTGATGFVGVFLLAELLRQTGAKIHCLVRGQNPIDGMQRLQHALRVHNLWHPEYEPRVIPVVGDLSQPFFGLSEVEFQTLSNTVQGIVHNGAFVHWLYPYDKLKAANVLGTLQVIQLASIGGSPKPIHYVSTTAVFDGVSSRSSSSVSDPEEFFAIGEQDPLPDAHTLKTGYAQSKWLAEKLMMLARSRGLPVNIYRPSYIAGDEQNGVWTTDDFLCRYIKGCIQLGVFPQLPAGLIDICSVDYVTQSIVHLYCHQSYRQIDSTYHLVAAKKFPMDQFFQFAKEHFDVGQVSYSEWRDKLLSAVGDRQPNALDTLVSLFTEDFATSFKKVKYDTSDIQAALRDSSVRCTSVISLLPSYFTYFVQSGFLPAPSNNTPWVQSLASSLGTNVHLITRSNRAK